MKDATGENEHNRRERPYGDETLAELLSSYTPKQRETLLKGFRILAKVAVRAHMKRQEAGSGTAARRRDDGSRKTQEVEQNGGQVQEEGMQGVRLGYYRRFRRNAGTEGWCGLSCYMKDYRRRPKNRGGEAARRRGRGGGARPST